MVQRKPITNFTDLDAWKMNHRAVMSGYKLIKKFPSNERYGLSDQLRRALVSITSNIAEGWGNYHYANKVRYYYQSRGSNCEVQNLIIVAHELKYISNSEFEELNDIVNQGLKLINGLIRSIEKVKNR